MLSILISIVFSTFVSSSSDALAFIPNAKMPVCMTGGEEMQIDNERVLRMKRETKNQYHDRGFVRGKVITPPTVENGHDHFSLAIGPGPKDTIEIVYNFDAEFGPMPKGVRVGDIMTICGDYITSYAAGGGYEASPDGALIHWTHWNPATRQGSLKHEHGFMMIGSDLIGFDDAPEAAWDGTIVMPKGKSAQQGQQSKKKKGMYQRPVTRRPVMRRPIQSSSGRATVCRTLAQCSARNRF